VLGEQVPDWRNRRIHESSPVPRGISVKMERECPSYIKTQFFPDQAFGTMVNGVRNENLEALTFADESLDITITLDVMEHVYRPDLVMAEVWRTLSPGGLYICTFPVRKAQVTGWERRFELLPDGTRRDFKEPEFHGNPVSSDGAIVTVDYGYDLHQSLASWAPFDVRVYRFADRTHGILGEYTEVIVARRQ
jgi:SAM-dependent methyltransferase